MRNTDRFVGGMLGALALLAPAQAWAEGGKVFNLRIMPINALIGEYLGDFNVAVTSSLAVGVIGYRADVEIGGASAKGTGYGARAALFFSGNRFSDSWHLSAYYYRVGDLQLSETSLLSNKVMTGTLPDTAEAGLLIGKQWVWGSGFNLTLAFGVRNIQGVDTVTLRSDDGLSTTTITNPKGLKGKLEFALGWAF